jgi:hypothetical protein
MAPPVPSRTVATRSLENLAMPLVSARWRTALLLSSFLPAIPDRSAAQTPVAGGGVADVPMFRGDVARSGAMPGPGITGRPDLLWWVETASEVYTTPAVVDGVAYIGDGILGNGVLRAIDAATGRDVWTAQLPDQP